MPAAIGDKFIKQGNGTQPLPAQLASQKLSGATTASLTAATGWDTSTAKHVRMYQTEVVNGQTVPNQSTLSYYKATLSGTTLSNLTLVYSATGSDQTYPAGATVDLAMTSGWIDDFYAGIMAEHNQDGTHGTMTADNLTVDGTLTQTGVASFTTHIDVNDSSTAIRDSSDNELVKFSKTASAVNELTIANAATANGPELQATGGDTNIDIELIPKGTGVVKIGGNTITHGEWTSWSPSFTGWSANPTGGLYYYRLVGKTCEISVRQPNNGTSNATTCTFSLPFTALTRTNARWTAPCEIVDNGVTITTPGLGVVSSAGTVVTVAKDYAFNAFTASGNKRVGSLQLTYEIA
jgi:hypothetical protein